MFILDELLILATTLPGYKFSDVFGFGGGTQSQDAWSLAGKRGQGRCDCGLCFHQTSNNPKHIAHIKSIKIYWIATLSKL